MCRVGKHSGTADGEGSPPPAPLRQRLLILGAGTLATVIAWFVLVIKAIHLGSDARHGESAAWVFVFFATVGATACLILGLILGNKILAVLRGEPLRRRASVGGKRAAR